LAASGSIGRRLQTGDEATLVTQLSTYRGQVDGTMQRLAASAALDAIAGEDEIEIALHGTADVTIRRVERGRLELGDPAGVSVDASGAGSTSGGVTDIRVVQWALSPQMPSDALLPVSERETRASGLVSVTLADASTTEEMAVSDLLCPIMVRMPVLASS